MPGSRFYGIQLVPGAGYDVLLFQNIGVMAVSFKHRGTDFLQRTRRFNSVNRVRLNAYV